MSSRSCTLSREPPRLVYDTLFSTFDSRNSRSILSLDSARPLGVGAKLASAAYHPRQYLESAVFYGKSAVYFERAPLSRAPDSAKISRSVQRPDIRDVPLSLEIVNLTPRPPVSHTTLQLKIPPRRVYPLNNRDYSLSRRVVRRVCAEALAPKALSETLSSASAQSASPARTVATPSSESRLSTRATATGLSFCAQSASACVPNSTVIAFRSRGSELRYLSSDRFGNERKKVPRDSSTGLRRLSRTRSIAPSREPRHQSTPTLKHLT